VKGLSDYQYYKGEAKRYLGLYEKLQAENKKLRECVEFYANNFNYSINGKINILDGGKQARQCLKELEGEE